ncbi:HNH endonuclease [Mycetocola manganoxydans]|uniref:HNH endonuclease n=1 Tax=Mycetocola manganoxydans TaxID=699879 RepID=A0A3L6ZZF4_9MICO|nr:HNH endonuclease signature motif containing protein [Mycetocola manganoxydans]RLP73423.1 HNH endonuclease [Mycetocola manganoxydans]
MNSQASGGFPETISPGAASCAGGPGASPLDADLTTLAGLSADELLALTADAAGVLRRAEAVLIACSNEVASRSDRALGSSGLAARHGFGRASQLLEQVTGVSARSASRYIRVGALTGQRVADTGLPLPALFPRVGEALAAGLIGMDAAEAITRELSLAAPRADLDLLTAAEEALVGQATGEAVSEGLALPADLVAGQARLWRDALDPNGIEPRADEAFSKRDLWVSRVAQNGVVPFGGKLTVDVAAKLHTLFDAMLTPRTAPQCLTEDEEQKLHDTDAPGRPKDSRTPGQQRADIFASMIDSLARSGDVPTISGSAPTVLVTVSAEVLENKQGTGAVVGVADRIPYSSIEQILCDGGTQPVGLGAHGDVLRLGRSRRPFSRRQKLAIIARDGPTCFECDVPASGCEVHHVVPWSHGGETDVSNGVILCWYDHHKMHASEWKIEMVNGKPISIPPPWVKRMPYFR